MREPKFRAWDRLTDKMFPVGIIDCSIQVVYIEESNGLDSCRNSNEVELMQFTGLRDIHGKEVFEGDIVKIPEDYDEFGRNAGEILKVAFDKGCFRLKRPNSKGRGFYFEDDNVVEVIGNIYENQELLGEEE